MTVKMVVPVAARSEFTDLIPFDPLGARWLGNSSCGAAGQPDALIPTHAIGSSDRLYHARVSIRDPASRIGRITVRYPGSVKLLEVGSFGIRLANGHETRNGEAESG